MITLEQAVTALLVLGWFFALQWTANYLFDYPTCSTEGCMSRPSSLDDNHGRCAHHAAANRWERTNAETKSAGCPCGKPATHVRRYGGTVGGTPCEVWSCWEHRNVNQWSRPADGPWVPAADVTPEVERWRVG